MDQAAKPPKPRDVMPRTWAWIEQRKQQWGKEHVADCIRRGMSGEPDCFYAIENGYVEGTPFKADKVVGDALNLAVALGTRFAVVMRPPKQEGSVHGSH